MSDHNCTEINFRIDTDLLEAIKEAAAAQGKPYTEFILDACKAALGWEETSHHPALTSSQALEEVRGRLAKLEECLAEHLVENEASTALPTATFQPHEHPFYDAGAELKAMGQEKANEYCRSMYNALVAQGAVESGAWHVWAHLEAGQCVYNK